MSEIQIVQMDQGGINARILAKEAKADFRRVEAASIKIPVRFTSAEGKRFFVRWFNSLQLNVHFISVIARTRLDHADVEKIETMVRASLDAANENLNRALDGAEALFKTHSVTSHATYDTVPLELHAGVMSSTGRHFLDALCKFDQLMPLLQTLEIHEIISTQAFDIQRAGLKREIRSVAISTRRLSTGLQRRMSAVNAMLPTMDRKASSISAGHEDEALIERVDEVMGHLEPEGNEALSESDGAPMGHGALQGTQDAGPMVGAEIEPGVDDDGPRDAQ